MIPTDKIYHLVAGFIIGMVSMLIVGAWSVVAVILAAVGKELYDVIYKGWYLDELPLEIAFKERFDSFDVFATLFGGAVGIMLVGLVG